MPTRPRKRQRNQKQTVKRKRDASSYFMNFPIDIFHKIVSYLSPPDLLHLARLNKTCRNLLMSKSAREVWASAIKNVEGLPYCPSTLSEPQYVALLFAHSCLSCGTTSKTEMETGLLVRLCKACRDKEVMLLDTVPSRICELVYRSSKLVRRTPAWKFESYHYSGLALRIEVKAIWEKYDKFSASLNEEEFKVWVDQVKSQVIQRCTLARALRKFLFALKERRAEEHKQLLENRRNQITERLLALEWEEEVMEMNPYSGSRAKEWYKLVEMPKDPKPLTDQIWKYLYAKLRPLLEANRQERLEYTSLQTQIRRRECLDRFLRVIKRREPPLLKVKIRQPDSQTFRQLKRPQVHHDVFPFVHDALKWPLIQTLNADNPTIEEFQRGLEQHRNGIEACISEWQNETRAYLVDLVRAEDMEYFDLLKPPKNMDPDAYARLSVNQKLLLRADSLFYPDTAPGFTVIPPYSYDKALRFISPRYPLCPEALWDIEYYSEPASPELDTIHRHATAQEVARYLLKDLGKPNASFLEINQLFYTCQRCHDKQPMSWVEIIKHYLEQERNFARISKDAPALVQRGIIYRNVHAPGNDPMIRPCLPKEPAKADIWRCTICAQWPISLYVVAPKPKLYKHILKVHSVPKSRLNLHYRIASTDLFWTHSGGGHNYEEDNELDRDSTEIEADNEPQ